MSKKQVDELTVEENDIVSALGLGIEVDCFLDNRPRTAYPITLKDYPEFIRSISTINPENMAHAFFVDNGEGLKNAIALTFGAEAVEDILENVDSTNYENFINKVFSINGLVLNKDDKKNDDKKK